MPDLTVRSLLQRMLIDILHPHCSYHLYANYVYRLPKSEPASRHWCHAPLVIDYDSLWRAEFGPDALVCELTLSQQLPQPARCISIPYQQIYRISRRLNGHQTAHRQDLLYSNMSKVYLAQN
ncbi:hypothetical protein CLV58_15413 [Spirosoma oryzae]|uniref:Uncharacterized protein n=1 Tax=Spirosoma oryzae TaxID=1469603 RepID=A0A2T0RIP5_9BACT|nr:hypothetical protein [Spirosoma oryzae]PRY21001.1 hypothetical protein CLV58_15413 [Spirosoma oryzae]